MRRGSRQGFGTGWWVGGLFALALVVLGPHGATGEEGGSVAPLAQPYREGPLSGRSVVDGVELPPGAGEFAVLTALTAILLGLRASGLSRSGRGERVADRSPIR